VVTGELLMSPGMLADMESRRSGVTGIGVDGLIGLPIGLWLRCAAAGGRAFGGVWPARNAAAEDIDLNDIGIIILAGLELVAGVGRVGSAAAFVGDTEFAGLEDAVEELEMGWSGDRLCCGVGIAAVALDEAGRWGADADLASAGFGCAGRLSPRHHALNLSMPDTSFAASVAGGDEPGGCIVGRSASKAQPPAPLRKTGSERMSERASDTTQRSTNGAETHECS
jgi:hypothetical protein